MKFAFHSPFDLQVEFLKRKLDLPTATWKDIWQSAHDRAFVVAGAIKADLLADLHAAVVKAAAEGRGIEDFRKDFRAIVAKHGWHGWTGEGTPAGEDWRTRVIYQTNLATSHAAGRWAQINSPALATFRPYIKYHHSESVTHPRPHHLAWHGLVLPKDHPFWRTHAVPNGWGCRCWLTAAGPKDYEAAKAAGKTEPPEGWEAIDPKTGAPVGIDKGWAYAPGRSWQPDLDKLPSAVARDFVAANMQDGVFERWQARIAEQVRLELIKPEYAGLGKDKAVALLRERLTRGEEYPVAIMAADKQALLGVTTQVVKFSDYDAIKQAYSRMGDANFTVEAYRAVQGIMDDAELIVRETGQMTVWFRRDGRLMVGVIAQTQTGKGIYLKSLRFGSETDKRRSLAAGAEIFRK